MVKKILSEPVAPPSLQMVDMQNTTTQKLFELHARLDALVLRGLARDPRDRPTSAREMARELEALVPPAAPSEVGEWGERVAAASLAERAEVLAESGHGAADVLRADALAEIQVRDVPSEPSVVPLGAPSSRRRRSRRAATMEPPRALYVVATIVLLAAAIVGSIAIYLVWLRA
jgi:serine/threonine-protein kinase